VIGFALLAAAIYAVGDLLLRVLWRRIDGDESFAETAPLERASYAFLLGISLWLAVNWALALTGTFTRATILTAAIAFIVAAAAIAYRELRGVTVHPSAWALALIPIGLWVVFILWRGSVVPPDSHDVMAYHLPKAVFIINAHGYHYFAAPDARISDFPANYELLLADVLLLAKSDRLTEWIGTISYILFLIVSGAVAERWWGRGVHVLACVVAVAMAPVLLLHSGADKNDLLTCFFAVIALLAGARWYARGGAMPWLLLIVSLAVGAGTKPHQAAILIGLAPFLIARIVTLLRERRIGAKAIAFTVAVSVIAFVLGGCIAYAFNVLHNRGAPIPMQVGSMGVGKATPVEYGDWANLWRFPFLLLEAPFASPTSVYLPWIGQWWFWPRYEIYFSNFGALFTILTLAIPLCVIRYRNAADPIIRRERLVYCTAAAIAFFLILPIKFRPLGFFGGFPRYVAFIVPAVVAWTLAPLFRELASRQRPRAAALVMAALAVAFVIQAVEIGINDAFTPIDYALYCWRNPDAWPLTGMSARRACLVVDRVAGPDDVVAVDGSFDTWIYPAMGRQQSRPIEFVRHAGNRLMIPGNAKWLMVDQTWHVLWGNVPDLGHLNQAWQGTPTPEERATIDALLHDPAHWDLVYYYPRMNQAVFHRRGM